MIRGNKGLRGNNKGKISYEGFAYSDLLHIWIQSKWEDTDN